jgi:hypothetical protein
MYEKLLLPTIVKDKRTTTTGKDEINTALIKVVLKFLCTIKKIEEGKFYKEIL